MLPALGIGIPFGCWGNRLEIVEVSTVLYPVLTGDYLTGFTDEDNSERLEVSSGVVTGVGASGETAISGNFRGGSDSDQYWVGAT